MTLRTYLIISEWLQNCLKHLLTNNFTQLQLVQTVLGRRRQRRLHLLLPFLGSHPPPQVHESPRTQREQHEENDRDQPHDRTQAGSRHGVKAGRRLVGRLVRFGHVGVGEIGVAEVARAAAVARVVDRLVRLVTGDA